MKAFYAQLDDHIKRYENGTVTISEDIEWSMRKTVKTITHYILSRYMEGGTDNKDPLTGRRRPFRNIGNAIVDLEWRAKNIDRKSIEAHAKDGDYIFSLIVNKELQQWMEDNNFGKIIDDYQRKKSEYGSVLLKKTETNDDLKIEPVKWEYTYVDPRDIDAGPKIEKSYPSFLELKKKKGIWDDEVIDEVLEAARKDSVCKKEGTVEIWDVEGEFDGEVFEETPDLEADYDIALYNPILAVVGKKKFCLYKTEIKESRFKHDRRKEVEGRDFGVGVWEEVIEPQIWTNEAVIAEKDVMDIAGKVLVKTNKKGLPSAMSLMNGEIIDLEAEEFFEPVQLTPQSLPEFQRQIDNWFINMQRDQSAFPGVTGEEPKASTPGISLELQAAQGGSIFNKRRDQDGFFLREVIVDWVMPYVVKQINKQHVLTASYSARELEKLDEAIFTLKAKGSVLKGELITEEDKMLALAELKKLGGERSLKIPKGFITMDKIKKKVRFDITDEMMDDQRRLNALAVHLQSLAPEDPARAAIIEEMMEIQGLSAASFSIAAAPAQQQTAAARPAGKSRVNEVLPEGQKV
jgi:hypothetical protein